MQILTVTPTEINWHSGLPVFASEPFLKSVSDEYGWLGGHDSSGQLRCVLPYTVIRKPGFHIIRFRTETIPLADLAVEEEIPQAGQPESLRSEIVGRSADSCCPGAAILGLRD